MYVGNKKKEYSRKSSNYLFNTRNLLQILIVISVQLNIPIRIFFFFNKSLVFYFDTFKMYFTQTKWL